MKILLDSYALIEFLLGSAKGANVRRLVRESEAAYTTPLNLYEVRYRLKEKAPQKAESFLREIETGIRIAPVTNATALAAADIKIKNPKLGAVDCNTYSIALEKGLTLVTGDSDFQGLKNVLML